VCGGMAKLLTLLHAATGRVRRCALQHKSFLI